MKRIISVILLVVVLFILSQTNPGRAEYIDWMTHEAMNQSSNVLEKGILSLAGNKVFDMGTTHKDYLIFTMYETDFTEIGMGKVKFIGIFNRFIPFSDSEGEGSAAS